MKEKFLTGVVGILLFGCVGAKEHREPIVPHQIQKKSGERFGLQVQMMDDLGATTADQAATAHLARTTPIENPKYSTQED